MALSKTTKNHDEIQQWAESRGAVPGEVEATETSSSAGILRFMFPKAPNHNDGALKEISWDDFFEKFDANGLELLYQDITKEGAESNFNRLIYPENESSSAKKSAGKKTANKAPAKKTSTKTVAKTAPAKTAAKPGSKSAASKTTATKLGSKAAPAKKTSSKAPSKTAAPKSTSTKKTAAKPATKASSAKTAASKTAAKKTSTKASGSKGQPEKTAAAKKQAAVAIAKKGR